MGKGGAGIPGFLVDWHIGNNAAIPEIERALKELCNLNCCILFVTHRREWIPKDARTLRLQERA